MAKAESVYILGGAQSDFGPRTGKKASIFVGRGRSGKGSTGKARARIEPHEVETAHVGNFAAELYAKQGQLGAFFLEVDPAFSGLPTGRHEAACASGSIAILAASAEIEAGRYDLAVVVGLEQMKTVDSATGGDFLGTAAWYEREAKGIEFPFRACSAASATSTTSASGSRTSTSRASRRSIMRTRGTIRWRRRAAGP